MHPSKNDLRLYTEGRLEESAQQKIKEHLRLCEFCSEFCRDHKLYLESRVEAMQNEIPLKAHHVFDRLRLNALTGRKYDLEPLSDPAKRRDLYMAADGHEDEQDHPGLVSMGSFACEDPELILRLMRDNREGSDYLQLIGDDQALVAHVLVTAPEIDYEALTDAEGRAVLNLDSGIIPAELHWQVRMPDAVFRLEPIEFKADRIENEESFDLKTDNDDHVEVRIMKRGEGHQLSLKLLKIGGKSDFEDARIVVWADDESAQTVINSGGTFQLDLASKPSNINIRLFI